MKMDFKIRIAQQSDSAELRDLYKNTVLVVNRRDYSAGLSTARLFFGSVQKTCGYVKSDQVLNNVHAIWVAEIKENKVNL